MKELVCIICPRGCHLKIDDNMNVTGNFCPRGEKYAVQELTNPTRNVTSTMKVVGGSECRVPVKTSIPVKKDKMFVVMDKINKCLAKAPIRIGDVLIENVDSEGSNIIATKNINEI